MNQHSFRNFHIGDTAYTNVDLVEDFEPVVKYYAIIGYEPADGETGPSGDKFFIDSEVVAASSEDEAREKLDADSDANIQEVTRDDYEEYLEWSKQQEEYADIDIDKPLTEAKFGAYKYVYGVHVINPKTGADQLLGGSKDLADASRIAKDQAKQVFTNPWMSAKQKYDYLENMYISDDDKYVESGTAEFDDYIEKLLSKLEKQLNEDIEDISLDIKSEDETEAVDNNKAIVDQLQELLEHNRELESQVMSLQEKLSVCYAKDSLKEEKINSYKNAIKTLTEDNKKLNALVEKFNTTKEKLDDSSKNVKTLESLLKTSLESKKALKARLSEKSSEISTLKEQLEAATKVKETLNENYNVSQKERDLLKKDYEEKLNNSKQLIEKYKAVAKNAVNKYINSQAVRIGVKPEEIKNKLPESYGFSDIDSICEDLKKYKISVGRLPFNAELLRENKVKMTATPSKNDPLTGLGNIDDDVDSQLLSLAKIN